MQPKMNSNQACSCILVLLVVFTSIFACSQDKIETKQIKPRVVVTCDPELDDLNSMVRFLLFCTDYDVQGLIYTSSQFHWKGDGKGTKFSHPNREYNRFGLNMGPFESYRWAKDERFIHDAVDIYAQVYPNLKVHNPDYPTPEHLKSVIRYGNIEFEGEMSKDTPGSDLIKKLVLDSVPGTLFITAWGGQSTIARALKSIQEQYENTPKWPDLKEKISKKVMILPSGEQDDTYQLYTKINWPDIGYSKLGGSGLGLSYGSQLRSTPENAHFYTPEWMQENISGRGPFGSFYRVWGDGKQMVKDDIFDFFGFSGYTEDQLRKKGYIVWTPLQKKGSFLGEGDTPTYLNLIDNGLRAWENETYGGWSGRTRTRTISFDSMATMDTALLYSMFRRDTVLPDFFPAVMNSLAARFKWSVTPDFKDANHEPVIVAVDNIMAKAGEIVELKAKVTDPDGNALTAKWWQFRVGSYKGDVKIENPGSLMTSFTVPSDAKSGETIHLILQADDNGMPQLVRYHRAIITIK
jgi:hypothetical protein